MADVNEAFRTRLVAHTGTNAIISGRAWTLFLPQNPTLPAVTVQQISGFRTVALGKDPGTVQGRVQVDSYAGSRAAVKSLAEQARKALQRFRGTSANVVIDGTYLESETEAYEDGVKQWRISHDYMTWWRED